MSDGDHGGCLEAHRGDRGRGGRVRAGDLAPSLWRWLKGIKELWPEVPDDLLARVVPTGKWTGEGLSWNRWLRKRFESCESLVIHLFSGPDQGWWKKRLDSSKRSVLCLDKEAGADQDLLSDSVIGYLAELCESGKVDAVLGGPPCRTVSKLRFRRPGPPPLRSRTGPERFGLTGLTDGQRELAVSDAVLWFRQLWLFTLAQEARNEKVMFLKENPRDPEEYKHPGDPNRPFMRGQSGQLSGTSMRSTRSAWSLEHLVTAGASRRHWGPT